MVRRVVIEDDSPENGGDNETDDAYTVATHKEDTEQIDIEFGSIEKYLENLWDTKTVKYFYRPNFSTQRTSTTDLEQIGPIRYERIVIGGYPNGLLRGSRIPFDPELKPWLIQPIEPELLKRRKSECGRRPSLALLTSERRMSIRKPVGVSGLVEALRLRAGVNPGAEAVWELLRNKSNERLVELEKSNQESKDTFTIFTRECVLSGNEKPPLCDFVRKNVSTPFVKTMKNLKGHKAEKQFRKTKAMAGWAEQSCNQFQMLLQQYDLRERLAHEELINGNTGYFSAGEKSSTEPRIISQAEAHLLKHSLDQVENISPLKPSVKDLFSESWTEGKPIPTNKGDDNTENFESKRVREKEEKRCKCTDKLSRKLHYLKLIEKPTIEEGRFMKVNSVPSHHVAEKSVQRQQRDPTQMKLPCTEHMIEPLCWSQMIEQQNQLRQNQIAVSKIN